MWWGGLYVLVIQGAMPSGALASVRDTQAGLECQWVEDRLIWTKGEVTQTETSSAEVWGIGLHGAL